MILNAGPAEIVHAADLVHVSAHGNKPSNRLVNGAGGHGIGVDRGIQGKQGLGKGKAAFGGQHRPDNGRIAGNVPPFAP